MFQQAQSDTAEMQKTISNLNAYIDILRYDQTCLAPNFQSTATTKALVAQLEKFCALVSTKASAFQYQVKGATEVLGSKVDCLERMYGLPSTGKLALTQEASTTQISITIDSEVGRRSNVPSTHSKPPKQSKRKADK